ncbi:xylanase [Oceaniferula spumae]|uniref:Xylanase n=1 Tax=Oceaniferula spumae TaxID=2979115 RepID=A0AAT9FPP3_9BACT
MQQRARFYSLTIFLAVTLSIVTGVSAEPDKPVIRLWPIEMVGVEKNRLREEQIVRKDKISVTNVLDPNLTVYLAKSDRPTAAVIFCPGGAYKKLSYRPEEEIKKWNDLGISLFLLKYTVPDNPDAAFKDIQRAVRLIRHQADKWNIDPNRIGLQGNSAGGHLCVRLSQNYQQKVYEPIDDADRVRCNPNFVIARSAAYFQGRKSDLEFDEALFPMKNKVAPTFLTYSKDDKFSIGGTEYAKRLKKAGGTVHLKLFKGGGHGMRGCDWFTPATLWLKANKIIE